MPDTRNKIAEDQAEAEEASTEDAARTDEAHTKLQEAILQVPGLASNNARALAAALCAAGVVDDDMMREITTEEIQEVMSTMAAFKDGKYPKFLPKNIGIKIRAGAASDSSLCKSPSSSRLTTRGDVGGGGYQRHQADSSPRPGHRHEQAGAGEVRRLHLPPPQTLQPV